MELGYVGVMIVNVYSPHLPSGIISYVVVKCYIFLQVMCTDLSHVRVLSSCTGCGLN